MPLVPRYFDALASLIRDAETTTGKGARLTLDDALPEAITLLRDANADGGKILFIGNGGSAGIASHMAIDFTKSGGMPALAFNDGAALTCFGNDLGYENVFSAQISAHARHGDVLIAISSSGRSPNILRAVAAARTRGCRVITLSGFTPDNPLRALGDLNLYVSSNQYGFVEVGHQALLHAILDLAMGWKGEIRAEV